MEHNDDSNAASGGEGRASSLALSYDEVRTILTAAADVLFSDGVSDEFLDQWTDETRLLLNLGRRPAEPARSRRR